MLCLVGRSSRAPRGDEHPRFERRVIRSARAVGHVDNDDQKGRGHASQLRGSLDVAIADNAALHRDGHCSRLAGLHSLSGAADAVGACQR